MAGSYSGTLLNNDGTPVNSALVTVYNAGVDVLATLYSDANNAPLANPVQTNSSGVVTFFVADGEYTLVYYDKTNSPHFLNVEITADSGTYVAHVGNPSGTNDTVALQALLTAARSAGGGILKGKPGANYQISAPLQIGSGVELDFAQSTITLLAGSNCSIVQNYAIANPVATASDGATTAGSNVITTALGAQAVVGQTVTVAGAGQTGTGQTGVLTGYVSAATATTITVLFLDQSTVLNAGVTVTSAAVSLFNRDSNITIKIGKVVRGANGGTNQGLHSILMRHVDNVSVDIGAATSNTGAAKYLVAFGDVSNYWARARNLVWGSDGLHVTGPALSGRFEEATGFTSDDLMSVTSNDYTNDSDVSGEVRGLTIGRCTSVGGNTHALLIGAGPNGLITDVRVDGGIFGTAAAGVQVGSTLTADGNYGALDLGLIDVKTLPLQFQTVANAESVKATVRHYPAASAVAVQVGGAAGATNIDRLDLTLDLGPNSTGISSGSGTGSVGTLTVKDSRGAQAIAGANFLSIGALTWDKIVFRDCRSTPTALTRYCNLATGATVHSLLIDGCVSTQPAGSVPQVLINGATVTQITLDDCEFHGVGAAGHAVQIVAGSLGTLLVKGGLYDALADVIRNDVASAPLLTVLILAARMLNIGRVGNFFGTAGTTVRCFGMQAQQVLNAAFYSSGSPMSITGDKVDVLTGAAFTLVQRAAAEAIRVNGPALVVDQTLLTPLDGDLIYNSNAAPLNGTGVAIYNTTAAKWKNVYSGVTN